MQHRPRSLPATSRPSRSHAPRLDRALWLIAGASILLGSAWAGTAPTQDSAREPAFVASPPRAVDRAPLPGPDAVVIHSLDAQDDAVPLPIPATSRAGAIADELVTPASGDPFFLGFAAGEYPAPIGERVDPTLRSRVAAIPKDGRPNETTYAFVMFQKRMTAARLAELTHLGARPLGFHPHYCQRVALATDALDRVADHPAVRWVGLPRRWQRVEPQLTERIAAARPGATFQVYVNVYESDMCPASYSRAAGSGGEADSGAIRTFASEEALPREWMSGGWQERALAATGLEIRSYHDEILAFRGTLGAEELERVLDLDFVQYVELDLPKEQCHDESAAMIHADLARTFYNGGATNAAVGGIADTGFDIEHDDFWNVRAVGWDFTGSGTGPYFDGHGHGTHVAGTMLGRGMAEAGQRGVASGLADVSTCRLFVVKIFDDEGTWGGASLSTIFGALHAPFTDGQGHVTPPPHIVNHSWGSSGSDWRGTDADARLIDTEVYNYRQQHIFAAGNTGAQGGGTITREAAAKNALTVGAVNDWKDDGWLDLYPGWISDFSSRGPTGDGRWKPNLVAPGSYVTSVDAGTDDGYTKMQGTSMAAPHVTGVAAQLADRSSFLRYNTAPLCAAMMAGSLTKDGIVLAAPSTDWHHHLNTYGAGRIDALKCATGDAQQVYGLWSFEQNASGWGEVDFNVGQGATRMAVVMHYKEVACSSGASSALVNDLDMWLDREPFAPGGASGDYYAQQSPRDNTEIRIFDNPAAGNWRIKVYPRSFQSSQNAQVGLCAIINFGDTTPDGSMTLTRSDVYAKPGQPVQFTATVTNPATIASGVFLEMSAPGAHLHGATTTLKDGAAANLMDNQHHGWSILLGNIMQGQNRAARWNLSWHTEGSQSCSVVTNSENMVSESRTLNVTIDGTPPSGPSGLHSSTHDEDAMSCKTEITMEWNPAQDGISGLEGYRVLWDHSPSTNVSSGQPNLDAYDTDYDATITPHAQPWYFHIAALDRAGNWGATVTSDPYTIVTGGAQTYCIGAPNSVGPGGRMDHAGSLSVEANDLVLLCTGLPPSKPCLFYYGPTQIQVAFGNGFRCVGGQIRRLPLISTGSGTAAYSVDNTNLPAGGEFTPGATWNFQCWYRDPNDGGAAFNYSDGLGLTFCD